MIDKMQYYHGAAIVSLLENDNLSIKKKGNSGYIISENLFVFLKYTTKARTPWRFNFDQEEIDRCLKMASEYKNIALGLICGGDGVCGLGWSDVFSILGDKPGWISAQRKHNESYSVAGSIGRLKRKIPVGRWSNIFSETLIHN